MANRAHLIAGPMINTAMAKPKCDIFKLEAEVRAELTARDIHPAVVQEWANEPSRRIMLRIVRGGRVDPRAQERQRLAKKHAKGKARRAMAKISTAARKFFTRPFFRRTPRGK